MVRTTVADPERHSLFRFGRLQLMTIVATVFIGALTFGVFS